MNISRRTALLGTAATAVLPAIAGAPAQAAAPAVGKQNAGFYRYKVGDIEVTVVTDGVNRMKLPDNFVTNVGKPDEVKASLAANHMDLRHVQQHLHADRCEHRRASWCLIDTGVGRGRVRCRSRGAVGQFHAPTWRRWG